MNTRELVHSTNTICLFQAFILILFFKYLKQITLIYIYNLLTHITRNKLIEFKS